MIGPAGDGRREAYLATGPDVVDYLARNSEVKFATYARHPDYLSNRPGTTLAGRPLAPLPFDGRLLGGDFRHLRPPIGEFMALGGMMIGRDDIEPLARPLASAANLRRAFALVWRQVNDRLRHRRGTRLLMGNALVARLFYSLRRRDVPVWRNAALVELTTDAGRVSGAVLSVDGERRRVRTRRAVVLATGGIGGSIERMNEYVRPPLRHALAAAGADGDGMRAARAAGAAIEDDHAQPRARRVRHRPRSRPRVPSRRRAYSFIRSILPPMPPVASTTARRVRTRRRCAIDGKRRTADAAGVSSQLDQRGVRPARRAGAGYRTGAPPAHCPSASVCRAGGAAESLSSARRVPGAGSRRSRQRLDVVSSRPRHELADRRPQMPEVAAKQATVNGKAASGRPASVRCRDGSTDNRMARRLRARS